MIGVIARVVVAALAGVAAQPFGPRVAAGVVDRAHAAVCGERFVVG